MVRRSTVGSVGTGHPSGSGLFIGWRFLTLGGQTLGGQQPLRGAGQLKQGKVTVTAPGQL
ncbi:MAG: hypothetical protein JWM19_3757 [Actinomycetia bacterium]|jgi:hypothetical protein|nr:hypothetical protein [Actinomycetes bacterium]